MRNFSSKTFEDLFVDATIEGYVGLMDGLKYLLVTFHDRLQENDYFNILTRLSFCYEYGEWDIKNEAVYHYRQNHPTLWKDMISITDTLVDTWHALLTASDRPNDFFYFGENESLATLCRLTR